MTGSDEQHECQSLTEDGMLRQAHLVREYIETMTCCADHRVALLLMCAAIISDDSDEGLDMFCDGVEGILSGYEEGMSKRKPS